MNIYSRTQGWHTAEELATACGTTTAKIIELARSNHWPRVHGPTGAVVIADADLVRQALIGYSASSRSRLAMKR